MADTIELAGPDGAAATFALRGAEPMAWRARGRDLLWHGDPAHWDFRAPILFPLVGASRDGVVRVGGRDFPMPQHGFARRAVFRAVEVAGDRALLRLEDDAASLAAYPFPFRLDVAVTLGAATLRLDWTVANPGHEPMPYALGFHPAFPWPFAARNRAGHAVLFEKPERAEVPDVAPGGLLARTRRPVPMEGRNLPLSPDLFTEALVFLDAESRRMAFAGPDGAAIALETEGFPHLAVWTRPTAPFLSLECWTGHADWADAEGDLASRGSMIVLPAGASRRHAATLVFESAP